jgi:hypothetical protein
MQVRARGFQWSQVLAEDVIFWYYEITNMSTTDYRKLCLDNILTGVSVVMIILPIMPATYNKLLQYFLCMVNCFLSVLLATGAPVGYCGYAFLESPGISDDNIDNDLDGLTDERRDNDAKVFITRPEDDPFILKTLPSGYCQLQKLLRLFMAPTLGC